mgnify:CR=1 FL=1
MSFKKPGLYMVSAGFGETNISVYSYLDTTGELANFSGSGYFPENSNIKLNDFIFVIGSDGPAILYVTGVDPITTSVFNPAGGAYIVQSHVGSTSGAATDSFSLPGVLSSDNCIAQVNSAAGNAIESAVCTEDQVEVWYEGTPSAGQNVFITVIRNT